MIRRLAAGAVLLALAAPGVLHAQDAGGTDGLERAFAALREQIAIQRTKDGPPPPVAKPSVAAPDEELTRRLNDLERQNAMLTASLDQLQAQLDEANARARRAEQQIATQGKADDARAQGAAAAAAAQLGTAQATIEQLQAAIRQLKTERTESVIAEEHTPLLAPGADAEDDSSDLRAQLEAAKRRISELEAR